jgi:hypothetical protein
MNNSNREPGVFQTSIERPRRIRAGRADESPAIPVDVVAIDDSLNDDERAERERLERVVENSVFEAGRALKELRDRRLYRDIFPTFEDYCQSRFGFGRRYPYHLIRATAVVDNLIEMCTNCSQNSDSESGESGIVLPTNEGQVRPLTGLPPSEQVEVWTAAVEEAGGKVPPARVVKDIVQRIREKTNLPNPYRVGDVCQILVKENPDLRGRGGVWCIVSEVHDRSCTVDTWDGQLQVAIQNLKNLEYSIEQRQRIGECRERLFKLHGFYNDKTVRLMLEAIGKSTSPYLSPIEERLLDFLETERERESGNGAGGSIANGNALEATAPGGAESNGRRSAR